MTVGSIILLALFAVLLVAWPILTVNRNKKEHEKQMQLISSLKKGEYVLTYSGIFGKILEILEKEVGRLIVIETGEKHKNCVTVSENAIYMIVNNNPKVYDMEGNVVKTEPKVEEVKETITEVEEPQLEILEETRREEPKTTKKKTSTKKTTTKKSTTSKKK